MRWGPARVGVVPQPEGQSGRRKQSPHYDCHDLPQVESLGTMTWVNASEIIPKVGCVANLIAGTAAGTKTPCERPNSINARAPWAARNKGCIRKPARKGGVVPWSRWRGGAHTFGKRKGGWVGPRTRNEPSPYRPEGLKSFTRTKKSPKKISRDPRKPKNRKRLGSAAHLPLSADLWGGRKR